jgi:ABC-2 type transport system ATP-binding protein
MVSTPASNRAIQAKLLSFKYPSNDYYSLDNISLDIKQGQCLGIIGPNGAGKSTLISVLCGLLTVDKGELSYYPDSAKELPLQAYIEKYVALIPQEYAFYAELSVQQNLEYFIALSEPKRNARKALLTLSLQRCQLEHVAKQKAASLSGGYKRRLNIAIALSKSPDIIFLDEPTVGIDPVSRQEIISLLEQLKIQGKTLIYTSHMLNEVEQLCDDIILLEQGKAVACSQKGNNMVVTLEYFPEQINHQLLTQLSVVVTEKQSRFSLSIIDINQLQNVFAVLATNMQGIKSIHFSQNSIEQVYFDAYHSTANMEVTPC